MTIIVRPASIRFSPLCLRCSRVFSVSHLARASDKGGSLRSEGRQGSTHRFDELRELEPIRFVLDCVLSSGYEGRQELLTPLRNLVSNLNQATRTREEFTRFVSTLEYAQTS